MRKAPEATSTVAITTYHASLPHGAFKGTGKDEKGVDIMPIKKGPVCHTS